MGIHPASESETAHSEEELKYKDMYDYVVINDDIEKATKKVKDIIEGNLCDG